MARKSKYGEPRNYDQSAGRQHANIPKSVTDCANYRKLSCEAKALMLDAASFLTGVNNGGISLTYTRMRELGWSKRKLFRARHELEYFRFINISRQGGSHSPTLYSLAWWNVHHCKGKLDVPATNEPQRTYLKEKPLFNPKKVANSIQPETVKILRTGEISTGKIEKSGSGLIPKRFRVDTVVGDFQC